MTIGYARADSPLGRLLVAVTHKGVCAVSLGDSGADLVEGLKGEYPGALIARDDEGLGKCYKRYNETDPL